MTGRVIHIAAILLLTLTALPAGAQQGVESRLERLTADRMEKICPDCEVSVETRWISDRLAGADSSEIGSVRLPATELPRGYLTAEVAMDGSGESPESVQLYVEVRKKVPVALRRIGSGESIDREFVEYREMDITMLRELPAGDSGDLEGKAAARFLPEGSVLLRSDIKLPAAVEPGDPITLIYRRNGMEIQISCTARQAKAAGESIRLYSRETGENYMGTLINANEAEWERTL